MHRTFVVTALALLGIVACTRDVPLSPRTPPAATPAAASSAPSILSLPPCTIHWKSGVSGTWITPSRWDTGVVPGPNDSVCLDAPGTYTVTLPYPDTVDVQAVRVGNATSHATLRDNATASGRLYAAAGIYIAAGSTLGMTRCGVILSGDAGSAVTNDGTVQTSLNCPGPSEATFIADTVINNATFDLDGQLKIYLTNGGLFRNTGTVDMSYGGIWMVSYGHATVKFDAGAVTGATTLSIHAPTAADRARVEWNGGTIDSTTFGYPLVSAWADALVLGNASLAGSIELRTAPAETTTVRGNIGRNVRVWAAGCDDAAYELKRSGGGPTTNAGTLRFYIIYSTTLAECPNPSNTVIGSALINTGRLSVWDQGTNGPTHFLFDSLVNRDSVDIDGPTDFGVAGTGAILRNSGDLLVTSPSTFTMNASTRFAVMAQSTQRGSLTLQSASLSGTGSVGSVTAFDGTIAPGAVVQPTIGTITATSLYMDDRSELLMEIARPAVHDLLVVTGNAVYGGELAVAAIAPYVGGSCGDVVPLIRYGGGSGTFKKLVGFTPGPVAYWRLYAGPNELDLAGYNPVTPVFVVTTPLAVQEGGATASYTACINHAPAAPVTVTPTSQLGQLTFSGGAMQFPTTGWELPQTLIVSATDDATIEPPLSDVIDHTVTSTDPSFGHAGAGTIDVAVSDNDGSADLELTLTTPLGAVPVGTQFTVGLAVTNHGPTLSTGATFTIPPIGGLSYVSASGVTCTAKPVVGLSCVVLGTASGGVVNFTITAQATTVGVWPVTMTVTGDQVDANAANNVKAKNVTVN